MKLLQLPKPDRKGQAVYVLAQDDCRRGVELLYKGAAIRYFTLEMLLEAEWWGWVDLQPQQMVNLMTMKVVNTNKKLKGHQKYAKKMLKAIEANQVI